MSVVYLVHFAKKFYHAQHYLGYANSLKRRVARHRAGQGSRLLAAINKAGIEWDVVRKWPGKDKTFERSLKNRKKARSLCPVCIKEAKLLVDNNIVNR